MVKENISNKIFIIIMLYITAKLTCNPIFFRQIEVFIPIINIQSKITGSVLVYPLTYIFCDLLLKWLLDLLDSIKNFHVLSQVQIKNMIANH